jgi:hypothetical protein
LDEQTWVKPHTPYPLWEERAPAPGGANRTCPQTKSRNFIAKVLEMDFGILLTLSKKGTVNSPKGIVMPSTQLQGAIRHQTENAEYRQAKYHSGRISKGVATDQQARRQVIQYSQNQRLIMNAPA